MKKQEHIKIMTDEQSQLVGVTLSAELWQRVATYVSKEAQKLSHFVIPSQPKKEIPTSTLIEESVEKKETITKRKITKLQKQDIKQTLDNFSTYLAENQTEAE